MGSAPSRTFQSNKTNETSCSRDESPSKKGRMKLKKVLPLINISSPTCRRKAAFIKHEKTQSEERIDENKLWTHWTPRRFSWPNTEKIDKQASEVKKDGWCHWIWFVTFYKMVRNFHVCALQRYLAKRSPIWQKWWLSDACKEWLTTKVWKWRSREVFETTERFKILIDHYYNKKCTKPIRIAS